MIGTMRNEAEKMRQNFIYFFPFQVMEALDMVKAFPFAKLQAIPWYSASLDKATIFLKFLEALFG
jgi:hypothetical protein